jgi:hypothetical protein
MSETSDHDVVDVPYFPSLALRYATLIEAEYGLREIPLGAFRHCPDCFVQESLWDLSLGPILRGAWFIGELVTIP